MKQKEGVFSKYGQKIDWNKRVKAVCKPCWEIKYCPYGPLVENFQIGKEDDPKRCIIYGHICPVYKVAEPFTETKDLRNISRNISRATIIKVAKRDGMVCQICKKNILPEEAQYDHIIPWSKGGSSEEGNIRILCQGCNAKRSNNFEREMLVNSFKDHTIKKIELSVQEIEDLLLSMVFMQKHINQNKTEFKLENFMDKVNQNLGEIVDKDVLETILWVLKDIDILRDKENIGYLNKKETLCLKYRWGFIDGIVHSVKETSEKFQKEKIEIFDLERYLFEFIGFEIKNNKLNMDSYLNDFDHFLDHNLNEKQ